MIANFASKEPFFPICIRHSAFLLISLLLVCCKRDMKADACPRHFDQNQETIPMLKHIELVSMDSFPGHHGIWISRYLTTVGDFRAFVESVSEYREFKQGYRVSVGFDCEGEIDNLSWDDPFPGTFTQCDDHPVVSVSLFDAIEFCRWLTAHKQHHGKICDHSYFRLPQISEIFLAIGNQPYPWGYEWPPPEGFRMNFQSTEEGFLKSDELADFKDPWLRTSPIGSSDDEGMMIRDVFGNARDLTLTLSIEGNSYDFYVGNHGDPRVFVCFAGSSWAFRVSEYSSMLRYSDGDAGVASNDIGFRVVLVTPPADTNGD